MLELVAVPHSWIPWVQTGFSMALYSIILLCAQPFNFHRQHRIFTCTLNYDI